MNNYNLGTQMEVKNLLLKALVVSAIGCFGSVGMYYQHKLSKEYNEQAIADQAYVSEIAECYAKRYSNNDILYLNRINDVLVKCMKDDGYKNSDIFRIMHEGHIEGLKLWMDDMDYDIRRIEN